jgi:outer membrane immunogenic protein
MKRLALGLLLASIAGAAGAADMSARPAYTKAPMMSPATNWTGFYIGAMGGYASEATSDSLGIKGGFAGGTVGYNWQSSMWVLGIEGDGAWANLSSTASAAGLVTLTDKVQSLGTIRGRVGAAFNQILLYGTAGVAFADNKISGNVLGRPLSESKVHTGWAAGGGIEWMFTHGWSLKAEYLYRRFDSKTYLTTQLPPGIASGTLAMNSVQVGINYHF